MSALVLLNPAAADGRAGRRRPALVAALAAAGLDADVVATRGPGDAERLARGAGRAALVVAAGGDGTVYEVVNGLTAHGRGGPALGVLPLGTGDDFASALGVPPRLDDAARVLTATPPRPLDLGEVTWDDVAGAHVRRFANALGAGFDAHVAWLVAETKWLGGRAAYLAAVPRALWAWRRPTVSARVSVGGAVVFDGPLFLCEVGNGPSVGGGFRLTPDAVLDDGLLDVCLAGHLTPTRAVRLLPRSLTGAHTAAPEVVTGRGRRVEVEATAGPLTLHADGEVLALDARRVRADVLPGALRVVAPALAGGAGRGQLLMAAGEYDS
ncbi:diacylglycerol kinase family lipid kinase [Rubrivirga sp. S365]|uniref:Diacylglycerol kinase family lipid kinase n=1 Tax=Rubrivirga litoralis TaxID=3075598 RepID=A0ABU3BRI5_9BACT|nr:MULTISPECIES: diacylglycerol kinase family lipid kinase [unclassified Rubrivirga]MDT0631884.1 diacylglycerol kinase family lipid kinase [Rubrivirga sp. F394]MDT7857937.1 diacylglycerol kinase family lipid kinase [Rubrivirga sp. S365]